MILSSRSPPSLSLAVLGKPNPAEELEGGGDPALFGRANPGCFDVQCIAGDLADRDLDMGLQVLGDVLLPCVALVTGCLLGQDVLPLEIFVGPPRYAVPIAMRGFGKELVAIAG